MAQGKMGREPKFTPERVEKICQALEKGMTKGKAAKYAGINDRTLLKWEKSKPGFADAVKKSQAVYEEWLQNEMLSDSKKSLKTLIMGQEYEEVKTEYELDPQIEGGLRIKRQTKTKKKILPNVTAVIFALVNRDPDNWKNRVEGALNAKVETDGKQDVNLASVPDDLLEQVVEAINGK